MSVWKKTLVGICSVALFLVAGGIAHKARPAMAITKEFSSEELREANESMPMTLLGQFRTNLDAYLWLKTEEYLHGGILYRPYTAAEHAQGMHETKGGLGGFVQHEDGPTVIPTKENDWRGILGDMERHLKPFRPGPARHGDPEDLIPWYRIQTIINPLDTNAYVTCAFFLSDFAKKPDKALAFLQEGIRNNPDSPEVLEAAGQLYFEKWKKYDEAIPYLQKAIDAGKKIEHRDDTQEKAFGDAYLFLARSYREKGELEKGLQVAEEGVAQCPDNNLVHVIDRIIKKQMAEQETSEQTTAEG